MSNLANRLNKIEQGLEPHSSKRYYIDAMKRWLTGQDQGESFRALPSLDRPGGPISHHEAFVMAYSELEQEGRLKGEVFVPKADFCKEANEKLKEFTNG